MRKLAATVMTSATLLFGFAGPAAAQQQTGLVNVSIGDITIEDVNVGVAAAVAANVCGVKVGPIAVLAVQVDASGDTETVCTIGDQDVTIEQDA